jgi:hypothetical protein
MILTVSGWRGWDLGALVICDYLDNYMARYGPGLHVRVGDADGVDRIVRVWLFDVESRGLGVTYCVYPAEWGKYGRPAAGPIRNGKMLKGENPADGFEGQLAHRLLGFPQPGINWRQPGSGTVDCIMQAAKLGVTVEVPGVLRAQESGLFD